jgi:uncharacterized membrane protein
VASAVELTSLIFSLVALAIFGASWLQHRHARRTEELKWERARTSADA